MQDDSRKGAAGQTAPVEAHTIEDAGAGRIRETIEAMVEEEFEIALGGQVGAAALATSIGMGYGRGRLPAQRKRRPNEVRATALPFRTGFRVRA